MVIKLDELTLYQTSELPWQHLLLLIQPQCLTFSKQEVKWQKKKKKS